MESAEVTAKRARDEFLKTGKDRPDKQDLIKLTEAGNTTQMIADMFKVSYATAYAWLKKNKVKQAPLQMAPPVHELLDLKRFFNQSQIARLYDVRPSDIVAWYKFYGIQTYVKKARKQCIPKDVREHVLSSYFLGLYDVEDIAEMYNLDGSTVLAEIREYGLTEDMIQLMPNRKEFIEDSKTRSVSQLAEWYGTNESQILRWYKAHGLKREGATN